MRVLIAGGTGLIGRFLCQSLMDDGHEAVVLTRNLGKAQSVLPTEVRLLLWDGLHGGEWEAELTRVDAVVNLAGASIAGESVPAILTQRWTTGYKDRIRGSRVWTGHLLTEAIRRAERRPRVLVQASAVGYYGARGAEPVDETTSPGEDFLAQVCREWEDATQAVESLGLRRVIIRTGLVLAPSGGILPLMLLPVRAFVGGPLGSGRQFLPWIHIADEVAAIRFLLENETTQGAYNLTAPEPVTQREFTRVAARLLRRPAVLPTPAFLLRLALGEKASLVLDGQNALPDRLLQAGFAFRYPRLEDALRALLSSEDREAMHA